MARFIQVLRRIYLVGSSRHKSDLNEGFTKKYQIHCLVYFEEHENPNDTILREKELRNGRCNGKINLIEEQNPEWKDLYDEVMS